MPSPPPGTLPKRLGPPPMSSLLVIRTVRGGTRRGRRLRPFLAAVLGMLLMAVGSSASESPSELPPGPHWLSEPTQAGDERLIPFVVSGPVSDEPTTDDSGELIELLAASEPIPPDGGIHDWTQVFVPQDCWTWQPLPQGLIYRDYLAGAKQSRFRSVWHHERDEGRIWDITLGGHVGILRRGNSGPQRPVGFQVDIEGSAQLRLDRDENENLDATDFRFGVPFTWGDEVYQTKVGYYHISSHIGDEFLDENPGFERLNFVRETLIWGHSYYLNPELRIYAEMGYAFISDVSKPWEFQLGTDYSPACWTGTRGAPFAAVNYHIREELAYDGNVVGQVGWAWRNSPASGLFRLGLEYYHGRDDQFSFYRNSQSKVGFGLWYDY